MRIVDTHLHLVYPDRFAYPWLSGAPAINKPWHAESYFAEAVPLGIEAALHMEVDVAEPDIVPESAFVTTLPRIAGAIAACRPENVDFPAQLDQLTAIPGVRCLRRILHTSPNELSQSDLFVENLRRLPSKGLTFDLCVRADQLAPVAAPLARRAPDVTFILNHCGVPDVTGAGLDPWRDDIRALSRLPNVNAKISGIVAYSGPDWTVDTIRPYVEHVIDCFGWDRVVWGSDHPVVTLTGSLTRWVDATRSIISGATEDEQAKLLHRNAERIYLGGGKP
jgi:predicted TIM-barrel fold metal-dependent hydrolase